MAATDAAAIDGLCELLQLARRNPYRLRDLLQTHGIVDSHGKEVK